MTATQQQIAPVSNPATVMQMIESSRPSEGLSMLLSPPPKPSFQPSSVPQLRLHVDSDVENSPGHPSQEMPSQRLHIASESKSDSLSGLELSEPPTRQVQQLVDHLRAQQKELAQREADLQAEVYHWENQVLTSKAMLRKRSSELEQHVSQIRTQQTQLVKLQQSLVDSQQAIRVIVDRMVDHCQRPELKSELESLQNELGERFDDILGQWERLSVKL